MASRPAALRFEFPREGQDQFDKLERIESGAPFLVKLSTRQLYESSQILTLVLFLKLSCLGVNNFVAAFTQCESAAIVVFARVNDEETAAWPVTGVPELSCVTSLESRHLCPPNDRR